MSNTRRTILVDGNNLLHRAYAVFVDNRQDDPLHSPSGHSVHAGARVGSALYTTSTSPFTFVLLGFSLPYASFW